jgi:hypothetical protein
VKTVGIVLRNPARAEEALRAAVGQTLRGARVIVVPLVPLPAGSRALATLRALGHVVDGELGALRDCQAVEVWS